MSQDSKNQEPLRELTEEEKVRLDNIISSRPMLRKLQPPQPPQPPQVINLIPFTDEEVEAARNTMLDLEEEQQGIRQTLATNQAILDLLEKIVRCR
jgi:hypothetical protein